MVDAEWIALRMALASCRRRISQSRPAVQIGSAAARMSGEVVMLAALAGGWRWLCARAAAMAPHDSNGGNCKGGVNKAVT